MSFRAALVPLLAMVVACVLVAIAVRRCTPTPSAGVAAPGVTDAARRTEPAPRESAAVDAAAPVTITLARDGGATQGRVVATARWGSGPGQLGRDRPSEGNPEGPMSFAVGADGELVVLDQVNARLVRFGRDGRPLGTTPLTQRAPQDIALARDGTAAVLDRLGDREVAIAGPDGRVRARLPLLGPSLQEGGAVTSLFVDGEDVYVEREHGALVRLGDVRGNADPAQTELPGRPTRDGRSLITAGLIDAPAGRFFVNLVDRASLAHRFTREIRVALALYGILLLDTDRAGTIYVAVGGLPPGAPEGPGGPAPIVSLLCLDPHDGSPVGQATLPANTSPEETFREMVVLDAGGVLYSVRTDEGVTVRRFDCSG